MKLKKHKKQYSSRCLAALLSFAMAFSAPVALYAEGVQDDFSEEAIEMPSYDDSGDSEDKEFLDGDIAGLLDEGDLSAARADETNDEGSDGLVDQMADAEDGESADESNNETMSQLDDKATDELNDEMSDESDTETLNQSDHEAIDALNDGTSDQPINGTVNVSEKSGEDDSNESEEGLPDEFGEDLFVESEENLPDGSEEEFFDNSADYFPDDSANESGESGSEGREEDLNRAVRNPQDYGGTQGVTAEELSDAFGESFEGEGFDVEDGTETLSETGVKAGEAEEADAEAEGAGEIATEAGEADAETGEPWAGNEAAGEAEETGTEAGEADAETGEPWVGNEAAGEAEETGTEAGEAGAETGEPWESSAAAGESGEPSMEAGKFGTEAGESGTEAEEAALSEAVEARVLDRENVSGSEISGSSGSEITGSSDSEALSESAAASGSGISGSSDSEALSESMAASGSEQGDGTKSSSKEGVAVPPESMDFEKAALTDIRIGEGLFQEGTGLSFELDGIDGEKVSTDPDGKPRALFFFKNGCGNCESMLYELKEAGFTSESFDILAAEFTGASREEVAAVRDTYGPEGVTFCYNATEAGWSFIYALLGEDTASISTPFTVYMDADGSILGHTEGYADLASTMESLLATPEEMYYSVSFDGNGAEGEMDGLEQCLINSSVVLPLCAFQRDGYSFASWNTEADGSGTEYGDGAAVSALAGPGETVTLYAQWTPCHYDISFAANSGDGTMEGLYGLEYGKQYVLPGNSFKRTGYIFKGWNREKDGSGEAFPNKAEISDLEKTDGATLTLYAQWELREYAVKYVLNGGTNSKENPAVYTVKTATISLKEPSRKGYDFAGWYSDKKFKTASSKIKKGSTGKKTFYAKWKPHQYTVRFNGNGADSGAMKALSKRKYGIAFRLTKNAFKRTGYSFEGWNTRKNGKGSSFKNKAKVKNLTAANGKTVTLYAQWKKRIYPITYVPSEGVDNSQNPSSYSISRKDILLREAEREGYVFGGWYSDRKLKKKAEKIQKGSTGKKTFYGKWTPITYSVSFNGNGAESGTVKRITGRKYDASFTLPDNAFSRKGYVFKGWNSRKNGKGQTYATGEKVKNLTSRNGRTVSLYALWSPIVYTVRFNGNGQTVGTAPVSISCSYGKSYVLEGGSLAREHYRLGGWNTKKDGSGTSYAIGESVQNLSAKDGGKVTLYAQWEEDFDKLSLGTKKHSAAEIRAFLKKHPISKTDSYETEPSLSEPYAPATLSESSIRSGLNAINTYRYIAGLDSDIGDNEAYNEYAAASSLVMKLNDQLSHYPDRPAALSDSKYDDLYKAGKFGASKSNLSYHSATQTSESAIRSLMDDSDSSNIDRLGHRRWLLYTFLEEVGFGKAEEYYSVFVLGNYVFRDSRNTAYHSRIISIDEEEVEYDMQVGDPVIVAWPGRNTPVSWFRGSSGNLPAWSVSFGESLDGDKIRVELERESDGEKWLFSSESADGYFNVENSNYGDPGCVIFRPEGLSISAGDCFHVKIKDYSRFTILEYDVKFFKE